MPAIAEHLDRTRPVADLPLRNLTVIDRTLLSYVWSVAASVRSGIRSPVYRATCLASGRSVRLLVQRLVLHSVTTVSSFHHDLAYGLVPIFVLGLCLISWVFSCASKVFRRVLIIGSLRHLRPSHVLHPIELQNKHLQIH